MTDLQAIEFLCENKKSNYDVRKFVSKYYEFENCSDEEGPTVCKFKYLFIECCRNYLVKYFNRVRKRRPSMEVLKEERRLRMEISEDLNKFRQHYWFWNRIKLKKEYKND